MKRFLCVLLSVLIVFASFGSTISAKTDGYNFVTVEKDFGEVFFDCDYAEIGKEIAVTVNDRENEKFLYKWYIDGKLISNTSSTYTPLEADLESMLEVKVYDYNGVLVGKTSMLISELPVIYIETEGREEVVIKDKYLDAHLKIQGNAEFNSADCLYDGKTQIRGRGNSTWAADKKPYRLKLDSKADLFGMGKSKHWVLLSNPFDTSLLRNSVSYSLAEDFGLQFEKSVWVDVVFNGKVVGNYQLCEHIRVDDTRVDITNWEDVAEDAAKAIYKKNQDIMTKDERDELIDIMIEDMSWTTSDKVTFKGVSYTVSDYFDCPDINGGYLLEIGFDEDKPSFITDSGVSVCIDTPDTLSEDMLGYIQEYYQAFETALFSDDFCTTYNGQTMRYTDFIDLESFVKGLLVNEIFENADFGYKSTWVSKDIDGKLVYGPVWDMDYTTASTSFYKWTSLNIKWLARFLSDPVFLESLRETYFEYRYTAINDLIKDGGDIDTAIAKISASANHNDEIWNNQISFSENASDLKLRLQEKIDWLDKSLATLDTAYSSIAYGIKNMNSVNSDLIGLSFYKENNSIVIDFNADVLPYLVKIFADGKECKSFKPTSESEAVTLPKINDGAIISVVCYDKDGTVLFGASTDTHKEVSLLEITTLPDKLTYSAGEVIDLAGLTLTAAYTDGTSAEVKPELVYTYIKDSIGEQLYSYNTVTEEIGETYAVLRYRNATAEFKIDVNPRENSGEVEALIKNLPDEINGNRFVREFFEAQIAFDALSETAKQNVKNSDKLQKLMSDFETAANETDNSVLACFADGVFRSNARSAVITVSKGEPRKILYSSPDGTTATYSKDSAAYISQRQVGNFSVTTIKHLISAKEDFTYKVRALYIDNRPSTAIEITVDDLQREAKIINKVTFNRQFDSGEKLTVCVDKDSEVSELRLLENGKNINATMDGDTLVKEFTETGKHTITLEYLVGSSWLEYGSFDIFVREVEAFDSKIYGIDYPTESFAKTIEVKAVTTADVKNLTLVCGEAEIPMTFADNGDYRIWSSQADISNGKAYTLYADSKKTEHTVECTLLDSLEIDGTRLVKFLADTDTAEIPEYITEIADDAFDGFEGTIICYPNSAAERFAKEKDIKYQTFEFNVNVTKINLRPGESVKIEVTASPYMPEDFVLNSKFDESVVSLEDGTLTALAPGYTKLRLSSDGKAFEHMVYVYVGGGATRADVNADEKINSLDALLVLQANVGRITFDETEAQAADVNSDGKVNSLDALIILQISTMQKSIWDYVE